MTSGTTLYRFWAQCVQSFKLYLFLITLSYNTISAYIYKSHYSFKNSNLTTNPFGNVFWSCLFLIFTFKKFKSFKSIYISHCIANNDVTAKIIRQLGNHCDVWIEINLFIFKKKNHFWKAVCKCLILQFISLTCMSFMSAYSYLASESNYCRIADEPSPWCYTMDNGTRWDWCSVPYCRESYSIQMTLFYYFYT